MKETKDFEHCWDVSHEHSEHNSMKIISPIRLKAFILDVIDVYKKHGLGISHEDLHGSFIVEKLFPDHVKSLKQAFKGYKESDFNKLTDKTTKK